MRSSRLCRALVGGCRTIIGRGLLTQCERLPTGLSTPWSSAHPAVLEFRGHATGASPHIDRRGPFAALPTISHAHRRSNGYMGLCTAADDGAKREDGVVGDGATGDAATGACGTSYYNSSGRLLFEGGSGMAHLLGEYEFAREALQDAVNRLKYLVPKMDPTAVYANKSVRMDQVKVLGFDYDYTLAHYTQSLHQLIYRLGVDYLVGQKKYPRECLQFEYDPTFPIRGLHYDCLKGFLMKLDFYYTIETNSAFCGRRKIPKPELEEAYGGLDIRPQYMQDNMVALLDLFSLAEACLISDVVEYFNQKRISFHPGSVYEDVRDSIRQVHISGALHRAVLRNPEIYLSDAPKLRAWLQSLRDANKKMFIITNSPYSFVDGGMRYIFRDDGQNGASWGSFFDVVVTSANKPSFYTGHRHFRRLKSDAETLDWETVREFRQDSFYVNGCLSEFLQLTKWNGRQVIYLGDHLYTDLKGPAYAGWQTVGIIRELEHDIATQNTPAYHFHQAKFQVLQMLLSKFHGVFNREHTLREIALLHCLKSARDEARMAMRELFNPYFGSVFTTCDAKESNFAYMVQRYADLYTSRVENFLHYPSDTWFTSPFDVKILPHHIKVNPVALLNYSKPKPGDGEGDGVETAGSGTALGPDMPSPAHLSGPTNPSVLPRVNQIELRE
eukprot:jgi/Mesvir1/15611/Mv03218-RA.1